MPQVSQEAYAVLGESLRESKPDRLERAVLRLDPASNIDGRQRFCAIPEGYSIQEVTETAHDRPKIYIVHNMNL